MGLVLRIRVVSRILGQALGDDVALQRDSLLVHFLAPALQVVVNPMHGFLLALAGQQLIQNVVPRGFRKLAPIPADDVKTFELLLEVLFVPIHDLQGGVLLLLQQHQAAEDGVDLDLQALVLLVHGGLDLLGRLHRLPVVLRLRVHKHGIRVAVDDFQLQLLLHDGNGSLQRVSAPGGDEGREGLRVEPAVLEAQAAVHGVRRQLQGHLSDLEHLAAPRIALGLDCALHVPPRLNEAPQNLRQDALVQQSVGLVRLRQEFGFAAALRHELLVRPVDSREADVVLLDDRRVQAVEVQKHHEVVVQTDLGLEHEASAVGGLAAARAGAGRRRLRVLGVIEADGVLLLLRPALLREHVLPVRQHELSPVELVAKKHLIALCTLVLEGGVPTVAREVRQLLRQGQDLQGVRQPGHCEGVRESHLDQVCEGAGSVVILGQGLRLHGVHVCDAQVLAHESHEVVGTDLGQQVLRLQSDIADETPSRQAAPHPEASSPGALQVRDTVLWPAQATELLPTVHLQLVHPGGEDIEVEAVGAMPGDDVGVELVDLRQQRVEHRYFGLESLHAVPREHVVGVPGERPRRVESADRRPLAQAVAQVPVRLGRVGVEPGVQSARDGQGLVRLLGAALQGLHADA
mmetsp:Transcript_29228/g.84643  ORF Transcript_29228/g.84643 Transcript_29228/m.84643 type:complete len:631 (+) Transcript_29228:1019-2911(+)